MPRKKKEAVASAEEAPKEISPKPVKEKKEPKPKKPKAQKAEKQAETPIETVKLEIQPEINIGMIGHVDHGKTTLVSKLSGKWTDTHSEEMKRGITIRLGYANSTFYKCPKCTGFEAFSSSPKCVKCGGPSIPLRKVSFVDAPGHETLMATMLSGAAIMDYAILLIAANEECPQPQTKEHLMALEIGGIKNIIIVQNKIDLIPEEDVKKNYEQIKIFVKGTFAENAPIIPMCAQQGVNVDALIAAIQQFFPTPQRDPAKEPLMLVARSFDINKPGKEISKLLGGVIGGSIREGKLKVGDKIEIKPGRRVEKEGKTTWLPITAEIFGIRTGEEEITEARPGGSIALLTKLDPAIVKADALAGNIVGLLGKLPQNISEFDLEPHLLERVVGAKEEMVVDPIKKGEALMLNVNSSVTTGVVTALGKGAVHIVLKRPICAKKEERITLSRLLGHRFRLIGYGLIK